MVEQLARFLGVSCDKAQLESLIEHCHQLVDQCCNAEALPVGRGMCLLLPTCSEPSGLISLWVAALAGWPVPIEGVALQEKGRLCLPAHLVLQFKGAAAAGAGSGSAQGVFTKSHSHRGDLRQGCGAKVFCNIGQVSGLAAFLLVAVGRDL